MDRETIKYLQSKRACRHSMVVGNILTAKNKNKTKTKQKQKNFFGIRYQYLVIRYLAKIQQ